MRGSNMPERRSKTAAKKTVKKKAMHSELKETLGAVTKRYGNNSVRMASKVVQPNRISTGAFTLDLALLGGIPDNRLSMVVGERHAGKSMVASKIIAAAQRQFPNQTPVVLDVEGTFESTWAGKLGVNLDTLPIIPCETGEMAVDVGTAVTESEGTSLLVVDSIAALVPMKEVDASAEDAFVGLQARLVGNFIRRITSALIKERKRGHFITVLFLNQFRSKIGGYGDPRTLPGGKALEFATSVQVIIKNKENKGRSTEGIEMLTDNEHSFTITKNKLNNGPRTGEFVLVREDDEETGLTVGDIDDAYTLLQFAKKFKVYGGGGTKWRLEFEDYNFVFGRASEAVASLHEDRDLYWDLRNHIIRLQAAKLGMPQEFIKRIV